MAEIGKDGAVAYSHYDRLSGVDATFLAIEKPNVHMHVGAVALFEAEPLRSGERGLDFERIRTAVGSALQHTPRFLQKLASVPFLDHPVWVDDRDFLLEYHVRHTSLPHPGNLRQLKRLAGRIMSQKLDRGKPLWEMWFVEGVEDDRFALVLKAHHCMVDGISGFDLLVRLLRLDRRKDLEPAGSPITRPAPDGIRLLGDELFRRATFPIAAMKAAAQAILHPRTAVANVKETLLGLGEVMRAGLTPTSPNPLNPTIGPHRRFDWLKSDLPAIRSARKQLGGTLNDFVLAAASGAIRRFLTKRGVQVDDLIFRAQIPMSIRTEAERGSPGNRVAMLLADLPLDEPDPRERLNRVIETTKKMKRSRQRAGVELLEELSNRVLTSIFVFFANLASRQRSFNVVITNVPGPPRPVYLLGAQMLEIYPLVPLAESQALGIALVSYGDGLHWGFNADWEALPDLHELVLATCDEIERLCELADADPETESAQARPA